MSILDNIKGDGKLQKEKQLTVKEEVLKRNVDAIMLKYEEWLKEEARMVFEDCYKFAQHQLRWLSIDQMIFNGFCQQMRLYQDVEYSERGGVFITALVQYAYRRGCNDLMMSTDHLEKSLYSIGGPFSGTKDNPLRFTIWGDGGVGCGSRASYSMITIGGNVDFGCGRGAEHSRFTFMGDVGFKCGDNAKESTFYSPKIENLEKIKDSAESSCSFYLINPDGTSKEVLK